MLEIDNLIFETGTEESERKAARGGDSESGTELETECCDKRSRLHQDQERQ